MTILVWSAGFNYPFPQSGSENGILSNNQPWFELLKERKENAQKMIVINGSFEQSSDGGSNSCLPHFKEICGKLSAKFDPFLMADLYSGVEPGTTYQEAMFRLDDSIRQDSPYSWLHDEGKLSILLAQMHKLAAEYPNQVIDFIFSDGNVDILGALKRFFADNRDLIPNNVKLQLFQFEGGSITYKLFGPIEGVGKVRNYVNLVTDVAAVAIEEARSTVDGAMKDKDGLYILNINEASSNNYDALTPLDFLKYYKPGQKPQHPLDKRLPYYPAQSFFQRYKRSLIGGFNLSAALIGASIGLALCLTGVFAPFGLGVLGVCLFTLVAACAGTWLSGMITTLCLSLESSGNNKGDEVSSYRTMSGQGLSKSSFYRESASFYEPASIETSFVERGEADNGRVGKKKNSYSKPFWQRHSADTPSNGIDLRRESETSSEDSGFSGDSCDGYHSDNDLLKARLG